MDTRVTFVQVPHKRLFGSPAVAVALGLGFGFGLGFGLGLGIGVGYGAVLGIAQGAAFPC